MYFLGASLSCPLDMISILLSELYIDFHFCCCYIIIILFLSLFFSPEFSKSIKFIICTTCDTNVQSSIEQLAHGTIASQLQVQKSSQQSLEQSANSTKFASLDVQKSHKSSESVSTSVSSSSKSSRIVSSSSSIVQSVKTSISSTEVTEIEFE